MARGFESKSVESQQEEAQRAKTLRPALSAEEQARQIAQDRARTGPGADPVRDDGGVPARRTGKCSSSGLRPSRPKSGTCDALADLLSFAQSGYPPIFPFGNTFTP